MIEGTRRYKDKSAAKDSTGSGPQDPTPPKREEASPDVANAANLARRDWFRSLIPAAGQGLVQLLRASNNLQRDLHEAVQAKTQTLLSPEESPASARDPEKEEEPGSPAPAHPADK